jgi:hypothetical protein
MTNIEVLVLGVAVAVALFGTPWLFIVSVLAITQPELKTFELFMTAARRLGRLGEVAIAFVFLLIVLGAWMIFIQFAVSHEWLRVIKM